MIDAEATALAVKALLEVEGLTVYLDVVPDVPSYPYVALFFDGGQPADDSLGAQLERSAFYPRMTCVASVPVSSGQVASAALTAACAQSLRWVRGRAFRIFGQEISAGGGMARIESAGSSPASRNDDVPDRLVLYSVETLKLAALAA